MFFSVKKAVKIAGKVFIPCVCYKVTNVIELSVKKLVAEGTAVMYPEMVFFQNGQVIVKKTAVADKKAKKNKKEVEEPVVSTTEDSEGF